MRRDPAPRGKQKLIEITGNDALTGFTAPKLLWVQDHEPENWARVRHVLLPKDYVRFRLSGDYATDVADGSGTVLFDLKSRTWSPEVSDALGVAPDLLPTTHEGPDVTGKVSHDGAAATGLLAGTPIVAGGATNRPTPSVSGRSHQVSSLCPSALQESCSPRPTARRWNQKVGSTPSVMLSPNGGT